jgi:LCP family protein required for cell wall assembly
MILLSINPKTNKVLLTSVPRDLWVNGNKMNALYTVYGWDTLKDAFEKITGQQVDAYIKADFEDFRWVVDAFGGVPVDIQRTFTDSTFPNNSDTAVVTVTFTQGVEKMTGERALVFARSRKGDNGEGSDLMRAKRQHLILQGMLEAVKQPESMFWPMDVEKFYNAVTNFKMETTLSLNDAYYLWDFYKDKDLYEIESFVIGDKYIYHPGMYPDSEYRAWVFVAREPGFANLHRDVTAKLNKTFVETTQ